MRGFMAIFGLVLVVFAGLMLYIFKQGLDDYMWEQNLASAPISVPADMQMHDYEPSDAASVTGVSYDPAGAGYVNAVLGRFNATLDEHSEAIARVFVAGDRIVAVRMQRAEKQHEAKAVNMLNRLNNLSEPTPPPEPITVGDYAGATLSLFPAPKGEPGEVPAKFRRFASDFGDPLAGETLYVEVITTASDADVVAVLSAFDWEALNEKLSSPWPEVSNDLAFVTVDGAPISQDIPPESVRFQAYSALQTPTDLSEDDIAVLTLMRDGELTGPDDLTELEIVLSTLSAPVLQILSIENPDVSLRIAAYAMLADNAGLSVVEAHILSEIESGKATQENLAEYLTPDRDVSDAIRALAAQVAP